MDLIPAGDKNKDQATKSKLGNKKPDDKYQNPGLYKVHISHISQISFIQSL